MIERIFPKDAPKPRGPYSPAVRAGDFVFVSGSLAIDPVTNETSFGDIRHETRVTLQNIQRVLEAAGSSMQEVVKCSVFLKNGADFDDMNAVYTEFFAEQRPARTTVEVKFANPVMKIEIDCIAYSPKS